MDHTKPRDPTNPLLRGIPKPLAGLTFFEQSVLPKSRNANKSCKGLAKSVSTPPVLRGGGPTVPTFAECPDCINSVSKHRCSSCKLVRCKQYHLEMRDDGDSFMCTDCDPSAMGLRGPPEEASGPPPGARAVAGSSGAYRTRAHQILAKSKELTDKKLARDEENMKTNSCVMREVLFAGSHYPPSQSSSVDALPFAAADSCSGAGPSRPALSSSSKGQQLT